MGTIPLVESFTDVRNLATLATHGTVLGLLVTAVVTHQSFLLWSVGIRALHS